MSTLMEEILPQLLNIYLTWGGELQKMCSIAIENTAKRRALPHFYTNLTLIIV